jgi:hypothetical protein
MLSNHCTNGATVVSVSAWTTAGARSVLLASGASGLFAADQAGGKVAVQKDTGGNNGLFVVNADGTAPTADIDTTTRSIAIAKNGTSTFWTVTGGAFKRSPTVSPAATTLAAAGVLNLFAVSPNDAYVLGYNTVSVDDFIDIVLASTSAAATPVVLQATATAASGGGMFSFGESFTSDSAYAIWFDGTNTQVLHTIPVAGGAPTQRTTTAWLAWGGTGSKVVFNDNATTVAPFRADLKVFDAANANAPVSILNQIDSNFAVSSAKNRAVFTTHTVTPNGLYVINVP